jgi:hypothetical protein
MIIPMSGKSSRKQLITTVVRFRTVEGAAHTRAKDLFQGATPAYCEIPGLLRKYFLGGEGPVGGLYFWEDRRAAERFHTAEWRRKLMQQFGVQPEVLFIERTADDAGY